MRICTYHNFKHIFDQFLIGSYYTDIPNTNTDSFVVIKNLYVTAEAEIICKTKTTSNKSSIFLASKIDICLTLDELFFGENKQSCYYHFTYLYIQYLNEYLLKLERKIKLFLLFCCCQAHFSLN